MYSFYSKSFSKINIGLRILSKRSDGYHDLETIFYPVNLFDEISIEIRKAETNHNSVSLKSNKPHIPLTKDNLCYKAIEKFFYVFKITDCYFINIDIKKNIPVGGGLGGGSSNAATILKFLIKYFNINIESNKKTILDLALSIGSDVPFFLMLKPCYAAGRGEKLIILKDFHLDFDIIIVNPNLHVSTKWAFEKIKMNDNIIKQPLFSDIKNFDINNAGIFVNDFEEIVFNKFTQLKEIKEELTNMGALYASMSGSGATMFGLFDNNNPGTLKKCRDYYKDKNYFTFVSEKN